MKLFKKRRPQPVPTTVGTTNDQVRAGWVEKQLAALPEGWRILDAGAGEQRFRPACSHLEYVSQDFGEYVPEEQDDGLQMASWDYGKLDHQCHISDIPDADQYFDAVLCSEVFEHLPNPLPAIKEFSRLVRPGGKLLISAPFLSLTHFAPYHFATGFNRFYYETHLPEAGFQIDEISCNGNFFELVAQELRRIPQVADRYTDQEISQDEHQSIHNALATLERLSKNDSGSEELACFGLHVIATKK